MALAAFNFARWIDEHAPDSWEPARRVDFRIALI
jgi:hypothetical protein